MRGRILAVLAVAGLTLGAGGPDAGKKKELDQLQGTWQVTAQVQQEDCKVTRLRP